MIRFIDEHKDRRSGELRWGIEPIAKLLGIAPSTYWAAKKRPPSTRALRDAELKPQILRVWEENLAVYGADKIWDQLNKDGVRVARCTVERLMAEMGLQGCRRGRTWVRTTEGDDRLDRQRPVDVRELLARGRVAHLPHQGHVEQARVDGEQDQVLGVCRVEPAAGDLPLVCLAGVDEALLVQRPPEGRPRVVARGDRFAPVVGLGEVKDALAQRFQPLGVGAATTR